MNGGYAKALFGKDDFHITIDILRSSRNFVNCSVTEKRFAPKNTWEPMEEELLKFRIDEKQLTRGRFLLAELIYIDGDIAENLKNFSVQFEKLVLTILGHEYILNSQKKLFDLNLDLSSYCDDVNDHIDAQALLISSIKQGVQIFCDDLLNFMRKIVEPWELNLEKINAQASNILGQKFRINKQIMLCFLKSITSINLKILSKAVKVKKFEKSTCIDVFFVRQKMEFKNLFDWNAFEEKVRVSIISSFTQLISPDSTSDVYFGLKHLYRLFNKQLKITCDLNLAQPSVQETNLAILGEVWLTLITQAYKLVSIYTQNLPEKLKSLHIIIGESNSKKKKSFILEKEKLVLVSYYDVSFDFPSLEDVTKQILALNGLQQFPSSVDHLVGLSSLLLNNKLEINLYDLKLIQELAEFEAILFNSSSFQVQPSQVIQKKFEVKQHGIHKQKCFTILLELTSNSSNNQDIILLIAAAKKILRITRLMNVSTEASDQITKKNQVYEETDYFTLKPFILVPKNLLINPLTGKDPFFWTNKDIDSHQTISYINKIPYIQKICNGVIFMYGSKILIDYHGGTILSHYTMYIPKNTDNIVVKARNNEFMKVLQIDSMILSPPNTKFSTNKLGKMPIITDDLPIGLPIRAGSFAEEKNPFFYLTENKEQPKQSTLIQCEVHKILTIRVKGFNFINLPVSIENSKCQIVLSLPSGKYYIVKGERKTGQYNSLLFEFVPKIVGIYKFSFNGGFLPDVRISVYHSEFSKIVDIDNSLIYFEASNNGNSYTESDLKAENIVKKIPTFSSSNLLQNFQERKIPEFQVALTNAKNKDKVMEKEMPGINKVLNGCLLMKDAIGNPYLPKKGCNPTEDFKLDLKEIMVEGLDIENYKETLKISSSICYHSFLVWVFEINLDILVPTDLFGKNLSFNLYLNSKKISSCKIIFVEQALPERIKSFKQVIKQFKKNMMINLQVSRNDFVKNVKSIALSSSYNFSNPIQVHFTGEAGYDAGGLRREFYDMLGKFAVSPQLDLMRYNHNAEIVQSITAQGTTENMELYSFIGKIVANGILYENLIGVEFATAFIKQLYGRKLKFSDMQDLVDKTTYDNLKQLQTLSEFEIEDAMLSGVQCINGKVYEVMKDGSNILLTKSNIEDFYKGVLKFYVNGVNNSNKKLMESFKTGFNQVFPIDKVISHLEPEEFNILLIGSENKEVQLEEFIKVAIVQDCHPASSYFWNFVYKLKPKQLEKFVKFITGSHRIPIHDEKYKITINFTDSSKIFSHTCFNTLDLPKFVSEEDLSNALKIIINERTFKYNTGQMS